MVNLSHSGRLLTLDQGSTTEARMSGVHHQLAGPIRPGTPWEDAWNSCPTVARANVHFSLILGLFAHHFFEPLESCRVGGIETGRNTYF